MDRQAKHKCALEELKLFNAGYLLPMFPSDIPHGHSNSSYRAVTVTIPWRKHKRLSGKQQRENHLVQHHQLSMPHRQYSMKIKEWMNVRMLEWECTLLVPQSQRYQRKRRRAHCNLTQHQTRLQELPMCQCEHLICPFNFYCELTDEKNGLVFRAQPRDGKFHPV